MKIENLDVLLDTFTDETELMETTIREMADLSSALIDYVQAYRRSEDKHPGVNYWNGVVGRSVTMLRNFYLLCNYLDIEKDVGDRARKSIEKSIRKVLAKEDTPQ